MNTQSPKNLSVAQVYVIQNELGLLKILNRHVSPPCFNFNNVEKQLHQHFSHARKHGEWFDLPFEIAVKALDAHFPASVPSDNQALVSFNFQDHPVRTLQKNGETWFCLKDACDILEIGNPSDVVKRLDSKGVDSIEVTSEVDSIEVTSARKTQMMSFVNEPNLYRVIFRSDKPQAKAFQDWVFEEVLPSIRKTGGYGQCVLTPEFQSFIRATVANEVNTALESKLESKTNRYSLIIEIEENRFFSLLHNKFDWNAPQTTRTTSRQALFLCGIKKPSHQDFLDINKLLKTWFGNNKKIAKVIDTT